MTDDKSAKPGKQKRGADRRKPADDPYPGPERRQGERRETKD